MNANIMCEYSKEEWTTGFTRMNVDSIDKLRGKLPELRGELRDPQRFQDVYNFAFSWAREVMLLNSERGFAHLIFAAGGFTWGLEGFNIRVVLCCVSEQSCHHIIPAFSVSCRNSALPL